MHSYRVVDRNISFFFCLSSHFLCSRLWENYALFICHSHEVLRNIVIKYCLFFFIYLFIFLVCIPGSDKCSTITLYLLETHIHLLEKVPHFYGFFFSQYFKHFLSTTCIHIFLYLFIAPCAAVISQNDIFYVSLSLLLCYPVIVFIWCNLLYEVIEPTSPYLYFYILLLM